MVSQRVTPSRIVRPLRRRGFSLVEMLVVISVIMLLISMLLPNLWAAKENARATQCMAALKEIGNGLQYYMDAANQAYPYGVPKAPSVINHPHYEGWRADGSRGGGVPPQQQLFTPGYIRDLRGWVCPSDPHPQDYVWWDYDVHPDITGGSSYMFSEDALFGVAWIMRKVLKQTHVYQPSTFGYVVDGWECPNGWTWATVDPNDPAHVNWWDTRIDWNHMNTVNVLYGDLHVKRRPQKNARYEIRTHPLLNY